MSRFYDNWEKLVGAVVKREELRRLAYCESLSSSSSSSDDLYYLEFSIQKVRLVRCPVCRNVLAELPEVPAYICGGCGTVLQARRNNTELSSQSHQDNVLGQDEARNSNDGISCIDTSISDEHSSSLDVASPPAKVKESPEDNGERTVGPTSSDELPSSGEAQNQNDLHQDNRVDQKEDEDPKSVLPDRIKDNFAPLENDENIQSDQDGGGVAHDTNQMVEERKRLHLKEKYHAARRHLLPVAGGAPIVACYECSQLLQIPADFLLFKRRCHRLRCNACKKVLKFSVLRGTHIVPYASAPPPSETTLNPVSYSDGYGQSFCTSCSAEAAVILPSSGRVDEIVKSTLHSPMFRMDLRAHLLDRSA